MTTTTSSKSFVRLGALQSSIESRQTELEKLAFNIVIRRLWDDFLNFDPMSDYEETERYLQEHSYSHSHDLLLLLEKLEAMGHKPPNTAQFFDFAQNIFRSKTAFTLFMRLPVQSAEIVYSTLRFFRYTTESLEDYLLAIYSTEDSDRHGSHDEMCADNCSKSSSHAKPDSIFNGHFDALTKFFNTQRNNESVINSGREITASLARFHGIEKFMEFIKAAENEVFEGSSMDIHRILLNWKESKKYPLNWSAHMIPHEEVDLWKFSDVNDYGKDWMDNL